jgi:type VI secretion system FHA domain protein
MRLELCVTRYREQPPEKPLLQTFDRSGGTVGRVKGNAWVLRDPTRHISSQHAAIEFRDGDYYILDTSANGVFVNDPERRLGQGNSVALTHGDRLYLGDYEIEVSLVTEPGEESLEFGAEGDGREPLTPASHAVVGADHALDEAAPGHTASQLIRALDDDVFDPSVGVEESGAANFLEEDVPPGVDRPSAGSQELSSDQVPLIGEMYAPPGAIPDDWLDGSEEKEPTSRDGADPSQIPANWDDTVEMQPPTESPAVPLAKPKRVRSRSSGDQAPAASPQRQRRATKPAAASAPPARKIPPSGAKSSALERQALQTILEGAGGLDIEIPDKAVPVVLRLMGELLRETVKGTMNVLQARASIRQEMRMNLTVIRPAENNPLKFSPTVNEALVHLLAPRSEGYLPPRQAIREAYEDLNIHQIATMAGMEAALNLVLKRFDPAELQKRIPENSVLETLLPMNRKAKTWELFTENYEEIAREAEQDFNTVFGKAFTLAYERHAKRLRAAKKK